MSAGTDKLWADIGDTALTFTSKLVYGSKVLSWVHTLMDSCPAGFMSCCIYVRVLLGLCPA